MGSGLITDDLKWGKANTKLLANRWDTQTKTIDVIFTQPGIYGG